MNESNSPAPVVPVIDQKELKSTYANICRIAQTPNEVVIDFGMNLNFYGQIVDEPATLNQRIILTQEAAKRLCLHLTQTLQAYEAKYGTIELDITKRLKQP